MEDDYYNRKFVVILEKMKGTGKKQPKKEKISILGNVV